MAIKQGPMVWVSSVDQGGVGAYPIGVSFTEARAIEICQRHWEVGRGRLDFKPKGAFKLAAGPTLPARKYTILVFLLGEEADD